MDTKVNLLTLKQKKKFTAGALNKIFKKLRKTLAKKILSLSKKGNIKELVNDRGIILYNNTKVNLQWMCSDERV